MDISKSRPDLIDTNITTSSRPGSLINALKRNEWDEARALLRRSDAQRLVEFTDDENQNALHACRCNTPLDIIQTMIDTFTRALLEQDRNAWSPLHHAIMHSSEEIMIMLLEACPRAASIADNHGWTPLHDAIEESTSLNVIHNLLAANPAAATATDEDGDTPLRMFFGEWNVPLRNGLDCTYVILRNKFGLEIPIGEIYRTFLLLLQAATHGSIEENQESTFRPLHAAINDPRCPWSFVKLILRMDPKEASLWDREQKLPIHVAAAATSSLDGDLYKCDTCKHRIQHASWFQHKKYRYQTYCQSCFHKRDYDASTNDFNLLNLVDKIPAVIGDLLATNLAFAKIPDSKGRLPLHIAIENETPFEGGLGAILRAAPKGLNTRDIKTHLYPSILAAVKNDRAGNNKLQKFTTCCTLLMENPHLVSYGIPH